MTDLQEKDFALDEDDNEDDAEELSKIIEEKIVTENIKPTRKLDYSLETPAERNELVKKIIDETPPEQLTPRYVEILTDYIIFAMDKEERKRRKILTDNRMVTVNKRETSFEGLVGKLENGEDGIYNMMTDNKNMIFQPKVMITKKDVEEIPELRQLREAIKMWENKLKNASGRDAFIIKTAIIELRKDQYIIKEAYRKPIVPKNIIHSKHYIDLDSDFSFDDKGYVIPKGASLCDPKVVTAILCNYSVLRQDSWGEFE